MHVIVIGYGRVGRRVVSELAAKGHKVTVIDRDPSRLDDAAAIPDLRLVNGNGIDVDVQRRARMGQADMLLAVTREDNVNLMAVQVARTYFQIPHAVARIWEPSHADICADPAILTVCPTVYAANALIDLVNEYDTRAPSTRKAVDEEEHRDMFVPRQQRLPQVDESRFILIMGGGKVGLNLARALTASGHEVAVIERDRARALHLTNVLDCPVITGDGSTRPVLERAGVSRARVFVAVTGSDQDNLIGCQLAKRVYNVPMTISRASNPKNEDVMQLLGIDSTVSSTAIIQHVIEAELPTTRIKTLLNLQRGAVQILEYLLDGRSPATGSALKDLAFPRDTNLVAILRNEHTIVPRGETRLQAGDTVIVLADVNQEPQLRQLLLGVS